MDKKSWHTFYYFLVLLVITALFIIAGVYLIEKEQKSQVDHSVDDTTSESETDEANLEQTPEINNDSNTTDSSADADNDNDSQESDDAAQPDNTTPIHTDASLEENSNSGTNYQEVEDGNFDERN